MPVAELRPRLAALHPQPWPPDRAAAAAALAGASGTVVYLADGVAAPGDDAFASALAAAGPVTRCAGRARARMMLAPRAEADRLVARVATLPGARRRLAVLAQSGDGRTLARADRPRGRRGDEAELPIVLPPELRNRLTRLVLDGPASAAATLLLDEGCAAGRSGLVTAEPGRTRRWSARCIYLDKALEPFTELRQGDLHTLLQREIAVIVLADRAGGRRPRSRSCSTGWRAAACCCASPARAARTRTIGQPAADPLLPERLLAEDRQLGGALSWSQPAKLAPFPPPRRSPGWPCRRR